MTMIGVFSMKKAVNIISQGSFCLWKVGCKTFTSTSLMTALPKSSLETSGEKKFS